MYRIKYAHCFVIVTVIFTVDSCDTFTDTLQGCLTGMPVMMIYRIINGLPWIFFFFHECSNSAMILTSDKKIIIQVTCTLFHFLHAILGSKHTNLLKTTLIPHFTIVAKESFCLSSVKWCKHEVLWHYIHQLFLHAQIGAKSSLVNNNHEYRFPATRYSWLSM